MLTLADAALVCSKPVINGGAVTPADSEIDIGEFYTVTCNDHHKLKGVAKMTCSKDDATAVLSSAPTCEEGNFIRQLIIQPIF